MLFRYCIYSILCVCLFVFLQSNPPFIQKLLGHSVVVLAMLSSHRWIIRFENILWIYLWVRGFGLWCLTPISTICQLYHDSSFYWQRKLESPVENHRPAIFYCKHTYSFLNGFYNVERLTGTSGNPYDMQVWNSIWRQKLSTSCKIYSWKFIHVRICSSYSLVVHKYHRTINLFYTYKNN